MEKLENLLNYIVKELVIEEDGIRIKEVTNGRNITYKVRVGDGELGRLIGKNGVTASAIRGVMQAAALKDNKNIRVEFLD
ncbi:MAG: KH domain-containing protein [Fusobacteriota bacterium]